MPSLKCCTQNVQWSSVVPRGWAQVSIEIAKNSRDRTTAENLAGFFASLIHKRSHTKADEQSLPVGKIISRTSRRSVGRPATQPTGRLGIFPLRFVRGALASFWLCSDKTFILLSCSRFLRPATAANGAGERGPAKFRSATLWTDVALSVHREVPRGFRKTVRSLRTKSPQEWRSLLFTLGCPERGEDSVPLLLRLRISW